MANQAYIGGGYPNTTFSSVLGQLNPAVPGPRTSLSSTEANAAWKIDIATTLTLMMCQVTANSQVSNGTMTSRKNSAAGSQTVTLTAGATGVFQDTTHSDSIAKGDTFDTKIAPAGTQAFTISTVGLLSSGTSLVAGLTGTCDTENAGTTINGGTASVTKFLPAIGAGDNSAPYFQTTEAPAQSQAVAAGTLSRLGNRLSSNTGTNAATVVFRKNTANGNQTVSIAGSSGAGYFEDTTHTDSIVSGDLIDTSWTSGAGTVNGQQCFTVMTLTGSSSALDQRQGNTRVAGQSVSNTVSTYFLISANNLAAFGTESNAQTQFPFAGTFSDLIATVSNTNLGLSANMTFRIGGADGNQVIAITPTATGTTHDVTHSDATTANALVNLKQAAIGSGTLCFSMIGVTVGGSTNATFNAVGVQATGVARAVTPNPGAQAVGVAATGVARAITPSVSVQAPRATATTHAGNMILGTTASVTGVHASGVARAVLPSPGAQAVHAAAVATAHAVSTMSNTNVSPTGVHATAVARGIVPMVNPTVRGVIAIGVANEVGIYATPISYLPRARLMRNTAVPAEGAMSNEAVAVVAKMKPTGPTPRSVEVFLVGVQAQAVAHPLQTSLIVHAYLTGVQATGEVRPVIGVGNVV